MKKIVLVCLTIALAMSFFPVGGNQSVKLVRADGTVTQFDKAVEFTANAGLFLDEGQTVSIGNTMTYRIQWAFTPGSQDFTGGYIEDTIPAGTQYRGPSATPNTNMTFSMDGGATWNIGEAPNGAPAGTIIRWMLPEMRVGWTGADNSAWNMIQNAFNPITQPVDINASRTNSGSPANLSEEWFDMKYDTNGWPCIAWQDNGDSRDTATRPRATLSAANTHIYFIRWDGIDRRWECQNGNAYNPTAAFPNTEAMIATPSNIWTPRRPRLALDSLDDPHIVYDAWRPASGGNWDIHFVHWDPVGNNWVNNTGQSPSAQSNVYSSAEDSYYPQIEVRPNDDVVISWLEETSTGSNQFSIFTCMIPGGLGGERDLLNGTNIASYAIQRTNGTLSGITDYNTGVGNNMVTFCMTLDPNQRPHIAFQNNNPAEIYYVRWDPSGSWRTIQNAIYNLGSGNANISNTPAGDSVTPWLKITAAGYPCVTWNEANGNVWYIKWNNAMTRWENVNGTLYNAGTATAYVASGSKPTLHLDRNEYPHIAFNGGYVHWDGGNWLNGLDNPISTNTTDGTGTLNTFNAPFNPLDIMMVMGSERVGISTGLIGNPNTIYDVAYIQRILPSPMSGTFTFQVDAVSPVPSVCNVAFFNHDNGPVPIPETNTVCNPMMEPSISKTSPQYDYMNGDVIGFDIMVNNPTLGNITNVIITDTIPANLLYSGASIVPTTVTPTTLTFDIGTMPPTSTFTIHIDFTVDPSYVFNNLPMITTNSATFVCQQFPEPITDIEEVRINETAFLFVKSVNKNEFKPNEIVRFTLEIENLGTTPFTGVELVDHIPSELIFDSIVPEVGIIIGSEYRIWVGDLLPGEERIFDLYFKINKDSVKNGVKNGLTYIEVINNATAIRKGFEDAYAKASFRILLPKLSLIKTAKKFQMTPNDTVTFTIVAKNVSKVETTNTILYDIFPQELVYSNAIPAGNVKPGKIVYELGTMLPGQTEKFDITFSIKHFDTWPDNGLVVINTAILTCSELDNYIDHAMLLISPRRTTDPLQLVCKWGNLDVKTGILNGNDLNLELNAVGGTSPYDYFVDWGDGTSSMATSRPEKEVVNMDHTYNSGEFEIVIRCLDRGTRTKILKRKITVK
jgi:uncharacterized repeat protein (TIGR01451 family)